MATTPLATAPEPDATPADTDWKALYKDLVSEYDQLDGAHRLDATTWKKAISRLCDALDDLAQADPGTVPPLAAVLANNPSANEVVTAANDFCLRLPDRQADEAPGELLLQPLAPAIVDSIVLLTTNLPKFSAIEQPLKLLLARAQTINQVADLSAALEQLAPITEQIDLAVEQERLQSAGFLNLIWQRLSELSGYLASTQDQRKQSTLANSQFQDGIAEKVNELITQASTAESLPALRDLVGQSVAQISEQVNSYVAAELPRMRSAEEQCQKLAGEVNELRQQTETLQQALEEKQQEANRNVLTGLANRRAFDQVLNHEHSRWQRHGRPLSLVFLDIDCFKRINDEYGHKAGDAALTSIARILRKSLREHDLLARYAGEEFVALLPDASQQTAYEVAEKLRVAVMSTHFHFQDQPV